uniref:Tubulin domain-containing protein n=1 Tax=Macrostomum lignano TaxID=282301 RepID=A0A1I8FKI5_9PLAT
QVASALAYSRALVLPPLALAGDRLLAAGMKAAAERHGLARKSPTRRENFRLRRHIWLAPASLRDMRSGRQGGRLRGLLAQTRWQCTVLRPPPAAELGMQIPQTQSIVVQVGQCGNQIGSRFWESGTAGARVRQPAGDFDDSLGTFFRQQPGEGQVSETRGSAGGHGGGVADYAAVFDHSAADHGRVGSGNNWAVGHCEYGLRHREALSESHSQRCAEQCDCLAVLLPAALHGGGTGSRAWGTAILQLLAGPVSRSSSPLSTRLKNDDVITSPYNSVLAMRCLTDYADWRYAIDNASGAGLGPHRCRVFCCCRGCGEGRQAIRRRMNSIVANLAAEPHGFRPASAGTLNVDLNEISMKPVPDPPLHYLLARAEVALSPAHAAAGRPDQAFNESFGQGGSVFSGRAAIRICYLACALLLRGRNRSKATVRRLRRSAGEIGWSFADWNPDCWKIGGNCAVPARLAASLRAAQSGPKTTLHIGQPGCTCSGRQGSSRLYKREGASAITIPSSRFVQPNLFESR